MLLNLLPGLRDLRTPLAVGYLWLTVLWLIFHDRVSASIGDEGLISDVADLVRLAGATPTFAALTFTAYIVGAVLMPLSIAIKSIAGLIPRWDEEWRSGTRYRLGGLDLATDVKLHIYTQKQLSLLQQATHIDKQEFLMRTFTVLRGPTDVAPAVGDIRAGWLADKLQARLQRERDDLVLQLQIFEKQDLFQTYDRNRSESEFRAGIATPLTVLILLLGITWTPWALVALAMPPLLVVQALGRDTQASKVLYQSVTAESSPPRRSTSFAHNSMLVIGEWTGQPHGSHLPSQHCRSCAA